MNSHPVRILGIGMMLLASTAFVRGADRPRVLERVAVFDVDGKYGGWPANHGIWMWGNEILVGFSVGDYKDLGPTRHNIDREKPEEHVLARSPDGGHRWTIEYPSRQHVLVGPNGKGWRHGTLPAGESEPEPIACPGGIDITHPGFAMTMRMADTNAGESRFYYSYERGRTWKGPFKLPLFGQKGIAARTDYIVNGRHDCFVFLTASKTNRREGRVICGRTTDGGKTFQLASFIGPEPDGYSIMPSTVRLSERELLCTIRCKAPGGDKGRSWIEAWRSKDNGKSWEFAGELADTGVGNPPALLKLKDGRLGLIYGYRAAPYEMRALLSGDNG
ncbi:MAG: exo-alpha-sialidase, partial [Verrucomicrobia bacterium]|nr:exo-alpha-sialidase [Verrucomicrobiota bacterium]